MTGGRLSSDKGSQRWNDQAVDNLQRLVDKYTTQLKALPKLDRRSQEEENLQVDLADLEDRIRRNQEELKALDRNIQSKKKELQFYKQQLKEWQPKYKEKEQRLQSHQAELKSYQDTVDQVADQVFAAFCQRLGYASIRDYESQQGTVQQEAAEKRVEFTKQRSKLQNLLSFHESQLKGTEEGIQSIREKAARDEANIKGFEAEKEELQSNIDVLNAELETFQEQLEALQNKLSERATAVSDARKELDKRNEAVKGVMKSVDTEEANIKRTAASRYALLRKCRMDEIKIPLAEGSASLNSLPMGDAARQDPDAMDIDEDPDSTQIQQPEVDDYGIEVNFDDLDDELKEASITKLSFMLVLTFCRMTPRRVAPNFRTPSAHSTLRLTSRTLICVPATASNRHKCGSKKRRKCGRHLESLLPKRGRTLKTSNRNEWTYSKKRSIIFQRTSAAHTRTSPRARSSRLADRLT